ncbi:AfsR/SARP family transcriptional regulator [Actinophytocola sp.]|uniref:AfsR/SARP family transcriptional regulator n=1 Tax=Actinophytocola sp. TaxID=1872138 RepID=UPI002D7F8E7B|nr:BTAD domain-containing putative transcriptional regulator [Actinophytocola sp.]HET9140046.1 BTAD domain-containing putative transcriptional regulator [Actinophytocola sp.]
MLGGKVPGGQTEIDHTGLRFGLLGPLVIEHPRSGVIEVPQAKHRVVLATLLLRPGEVVSADELILRLWGENPPATARKTLQGYIARLRRTLTPGLVASHPAGYRARVRPEQVDCGRFRRLLDELRDRPARDPAPLLREALALFRGTPLADVPSEYLHQHDAVALIDQRLDLVERLADTELTFGRSANVVAVLRETLAEHPFRESLWYRLVLALYSCGRVAEALAAYQDARRLLVDQLGVEPGTDLRDAHRRVLRASDETPAAAPEAHRAELATAVHLLTSAATDRPVVVAVSGPAGVGKTALAKRIAASAAARFPAGLVEVRMSDGAHGRAQPDVLADLLAGMEVAPAGADTRLERYHSELARRPVLVVLDDAVHPDQVRPLLPRSGRSAVLVTSRPAPVSLAGARQVRLEPLTTQAGLDALTEIIGPDRLHGQEDAGAELVRLCDHLPLAIRAAGIRLLERPYLLLRQLVDRLVDPAGRLDVLTVEGVDVRASLTLGYQRLDPTARRALRLLSLLRTDSFPPRVAAAALNVPEADADRLLARLTAAQLLLIEPDERYGHRYRHRELVRICAREHAIAEEPPAERRRAVTMALSAWYHRSGPPAAATAKPVRHAVVGRFPSED